MGVVHLDYKNARDFLVFHTVFFVFILFFSSWLPLSWPGWYCLSGSLVPWYDFGSVFLAFTFSLKTGYTLFTSGHCACDHGRT